MRTRRQSRGRGGRGGFEPRTRIRAREGHVLEQMLEGRSQHEIAVSLGISQPAVCKILQRLETRMLSDAALKIERQRVRHTAQLQFLYREAVAAWKKSQADAVRRRQQKREGRAATGSLAEIVSENRHGDPRYLEQARKTLEDLRAVWGLDAPERLSIEATSPFATMSDAALEAEIVRQARLLRQLGAATIIEVPVKEGAHEE